MPDTFAPTTQPSTQSKRDAVPRVNIAQFGDGYTQRSEDGLNAVENMYNAVWPELWAADANSMESFFRAHKSTYFLWAAPDDVSRKWIARSWQRGSLSAGVTSLSAVFKEVFDL